jgi:outer membrane protein W
MRTLFLGIAVAILACTRLSGGCAIASEERHGGFSLGYGSLTPAQSDPKAEQYGQLVAKYRLSSSGNFKPYLGTGLGFIYQPDIKAYDPARIRTGVAGEAGFSYLLGESSALTFDYKFLDVGPGSSRDRGSSTPQSVGVGLEIRF